MERNDSFLNFLVSRRSVKSYLAEMPTHEDIERIVDAGLRAPSGMNSQSSKFVVVTDTSLRKRLMVTNAEIMGRSGIDPFYGAPVLVIVFANKDCRTGIYDATLSASEMLHAADALGLGACWIHRAKETFEMKEWREWLREKGIGDEYIGVGNIIIGYAEGERRTVPAVRPGRVVWE